MTKEEFLSLCKEKRNGVLKKPLYHVCDAKTGLCADCRRKLALAKADPATVMGGAIQDFDYKKPERP